MSKNKYPYILESDNISFYDCDDTLVLWNNDYEWGKDHEGTLEFHDPYFEERIINLKPNQITINHLKQQSVTGGRVVVWSAGGFAWAQEVVRVLGLEEYVDLILSKPKRYVDDLPCEEWMGKWKRVKPDGTLGSEFGGNRDIRSKRD